MDLQQLIKETESELEYYQHNKFSAPRIVEYFKSVLDMLKEKEAGEPAEKVKPLASEPELIKVGTLNKRYGLKGFDTAEVGHPVFEKNDRYVIYLKNDNTSIEVPFYKETLTPAINFI